MASNQSHSEESSASGNEAIPAINFDDIIKKCIWCKEHKKLECGKKYCVDCARNKFKECMRCHMPYPNEKYFQKNQKRCNACQNKLTQERLKRENSRNSTKQNRKRSAKVLAAESDPDQMEDAKVAPTRFSQNKSKKTIGYIPIYMLQ